MTKIKSPLRFSRHFKVNPKDLQTLGTFDPILEADTPLFIDPILLSHSSSPEISQGAASRSSLYFTDLYKLLKASQRPGDIAWDTASRLLQFHEVPGTCLGYGGGSIHGSGWGNQLTADLLSRASEIIKIGVNDPRLFLLIGLFSEGIGPDRISDMITNISLPDIAAYTERICDSLGVPVEEFSLQENDYFLPINPCQKRRTPILLLPRDILRDLPIASSIEEIWEAAAHNDELRRGINGQIGILWEKVNKEQKHEVLNALLKDPKYANDLIARLTEIHSGSYDQTADERGYLIWSDLAYEIAGNFPKLISAASELSYAELNRIVIAIIEQFRFLMENRDLWRVLHDSDSRKTEKTAQRLFFAVAYAYCIANNLDVVPEADTGNGPVDFKFSKGAHPKILVELKLSKNNIQHGHDIQLPTYVSAEDADGSHYVVIDVGKIGKKWLTLQAERSNRKQTEPCIWLIDAQDRASASVR